METENTQTFSDQKPIKVCAYNEADTYPAFLQPRHIHRARQPQQEPAAHIRRPHAERCNHRAQLTPA